jgi:hypothetical protein
MREHEGFVHPAAMGWAAYEGAANPRNVCNITLVTIKIVLAQWPSASLLSKDRQLSTGSASC